ncbi:uncharacterized protein LOC123665508 [Melitaea cinxia]|uniref:uncharacterized protein LOC123665508 n=1 Tax=Melitaea cinxia TaxID=113334 RepID=UPI001E27352E|nr:uncharacterized protein LOC123665508 [Melitaea cinxia]
MKFLIAVFLLALAAISSSNVLSITRNNLNIGVIRPGDRLLRSASVYRPPRPNAVQYEDFVFNGNRNTLISSINATEVGARQLPTAYILRGGLGANNVTIRIQSAIGRGYNYSIRIYGR